MALKNSPQYIESNTMTVKVLALTRYGALGASSRLRIMQYRSELAEQGIEVCINSLLNDEYVRQLYQGKRNKLLLIYCYLRRLIFLAYNTSRYDIVWIEKEIFPYLPAFFEKSFLKKKPKIYDYDDAIFHNYDISSSTLKRFLLSNKIKILVQNASLVLAGNQYIADYLNQSGVKILKVPTSLKLDDYQARKSQRTYSNFTICWVGTPNTWEQCFVPFLKIFLELADKYAIQFVIIGTKGNGFSNEKFFFYDWSESNEVELIKSCHIGIMPLPDTPWMRGKSGYKLIQYMSCDLPVIASAVGENINLVQHGVDGFLVKNESDWERYILCIMENNELQLSLQRNARQKAEDSFDVKKNALIIAKHIRKVLRK
jgi:glycosyltransferase involved in cell wall biosynthesis